MHNFTSSLNTLYTTKAHSFTQHFCQQRWVLLRAFAVNAKFDSAFSPKMLKRIQKRTATKTALNLTFFTTTLSHFSCFRRKRRVIENFEYLGEFEEYFRKCWLYCVLNLLVTERCKKKFKNRLWKSHACVPLKCDKYYHPPPFFCLVLHCEWCLCPWLVHIFFRENKSNNSL
jgi:hypothetical protein